MQNKIEIIEILKAIPVFSGLSVEDLNEIIPLLMHETFNPETEIIKEQSEGDSMYIIISGNVIAFKIDDSGEEVILGALDAGAYFGEFSLIDNMPRSATVKSLVTTEAFRLDKKNFDTILSKNQKIANIFYRNCLIETFSRYRNIAANLTFSQYTLNEKLTALNEISEDLSHAKKIQQYFINTGHFDKIPDEEGVLKIKQSHIYKPCKEIGGDFINILDLNNNKSGIIIADVMGHGITAALATGVLKSSFNFLAKNLGDDPVNLMKELNIQFGDILPHLFATCYYACIDKNTNTISFSKAGHQHPLFYKKSTGKFIEFNIKGIGLGINRGAVFNTASYKLDNGDKLLFYTDGIAEQNSKNREMYSEERLEKIFLELINSGEEKILDSIYSDFKVFSSSMIIEDDITLLLLEFI
jgi:serine phosphatase RsbU (regulator of sigma subunit)